VGHPDNAVDIARVTAVREKIGTGVALMVDANQQWDRSTARRMCRGVRAARADVDRGIADAYDAGGPRGARRDVRTPRSPPARC